MYHYKHLNKKGIGICKGEKLLWNPLRAHMRGAFFHEYLSFLAHTYVQTVYNCF